MTEEYPQALEKEEAEALGLSEEDLLCGNCQSLIEPDEGFCPSCGCKILWE